MKNKRIIVVLVLSVIVLSLLSTLVGIFSKNENGVSSFVSIFGQNIDVYGKGVYGYNSKTAALQAIPHDIVTLIIAIPILIIALIFTLKGSIKGRLMLAGVLGYILITYIMFTFIAMFNKLFLAYVLLMSTSFFALLYTILSFDFDKVEVSKKFPRKFVGFTLVISTGLVGLLWLARVIPSISGSVPIEVEHGTTLPVQAFDLAFFLPVIFLSGILLLKRNKFGYIFASISTFTLSLVMLALLSKGISLAINGSTDALPLIFMTSILGLLSLISSSIILKLK